MAKPVQIPRAFYCEHTASKSRVHALVSSELGPSSLRAVLTCNDPLLAQWAADALTGAWHGAPSSELQAKTDAVLGRLPDAPAASFRDWIARASQGTGLDTESMPVSWADAAQYVPEGDREDNGPDGKRLSELSGHVVRVMQMTEVWVRDPARVVASARTEGWKPMPDIDADALDVLGAVMHHCEPADDIPGAVIIDEQSEGSELSIDAGDEIADWSAEPVSATFSTGFRLREKARAGSQGLPDKVATDFGDFPDFAKLFPVRTCTCDAENDESCDVCEQWHLTPRTADLLHGALCVLADQAHDEVKGKGNTPVSGSSDNWYVFDRLPRLTWNMSAEWRRRFAHACEDLAGELEHGEWPIPRCTAEEMALHLGIEDGPAGLDLAEDGEDERHFALPEHDDDYDWEMCTECLFQDTDVLMLFDDDLDGIEDPSDPVNRQAGIGGSLRPDNWFSWFANVEPRDPERVFRR